MNFTYVEIGSPGRDHDSNVFKNSSIGKVTYDKPNSIYCKGTFILGDLGFPNLPNLITPVKGKNLTADKIRFNRRLSPSLKQNSNVSNT